MTNLRIKRTLALLILAALTALPSACHKNQEKVISQYPNGQTKLEYTVVDGPNGTQIRVGERSYYEDGQLMYDKHFKDEKPDGQWKFYYADGTLYAEGNFADNHQTGTDWKFYNTDGKPLYDGEYDHIEILESTADFRPLAISFHNGNQEMRFQFNENYTIHDRGAVINGKKEGRWEFFYANGQLQLEAIYHDDKPDGAYNSYRENGIPYFRGFYINGKRANVWEFYDDQGELAGTQNFDD